VLAAGRVAEFGPPADLARDNTRSVAARRLTTNIPSRLYTNLYKPIAISPTLCNLLPHRSLAGRGTFRAMLEESRRS
jgi:hypothetical protein